MVELEGENLLKRIRQGDHTAMRELFMGHYDQVFLTIRRMLSDIATTDDIAQEVFIDIWAKRDSIFISSSLSSYIKRMAVNKALNYIRQSKSQLFSNEIDENIALRDHSTDLMDLNSLEEYLHKKIDMLPAQCRLVFVLSRFEEMSNKEIAEHLNLSVKTIENQMTKALKTLKIALEIYKR